jgi:hypothetical protein
LHGNAFVLPSFLQFDLQTINLGATLFMPCRWLSSIIDTHNEMSHALLRIVATASALWLDCTDQSSPQTW